ncbi:hypothetical protein F441_12056 [Phytophthora nicotianae CJ01A1]|uniref:Uncharacterized protein n=2 Tax=Phytophthora nicotianae TaxID=4792 RepID=W2GKX4_PHYNI|nr:hypothetical protein L915_11805 [Phytophthora nicotianae]ETL36271.1 hypothetical protein L916_11730 [Phytophthora nicotianae]ETP12591.1 hypothetical protein F441_12056 [Phytophthora nicotianae CJ01A1]
MPAITEKLKLGDIQTNDDEKSTFEAVDQLRRIIRGHKHRRLGERATHCRRLCEGLLQYRHRGRKACGSVYTRGGAAFSPEVVRPDQGPAVSDDHFYVHLSIADIGFCTDYLLVNSLTHHMIYPTLVSDLLDLPTAFRRRAVQLPGIPKDSDWSGAMDGFQSGEPADSSEPSMLWDRSYVDNILEATESWDALREGRPTFGRSRPVERGDPCHQALLVMLQGGSPRTSRVRRRPRGLFEGSGVAGELPFPGTLCLMQIFLATSTTIFTTYASNPYELGEVDFFERIERRTMRLGMRRWTVA